MKENLTTKDFNERDEHSLIEIKNILDVIIEKFREIMTLTPYKGKVANFLKSEYFKGMDDLEKEIKPDINFVPSSENVQVMENLYNYVYQNLQAHADTVGNNLRQELQRGLINKEGIPQLKERVKEAFKGKQVNARLKTVLRTEKMRAYNMGSLEGAHQAEAAGVKLKKYLDVTMDNRTSDCCKGGEKEFSKPKDAIPLDQEFKFKGTDGKTYGGQGPPFLPNCRTVLRYVREE